MSVMSTGGRALGLDVSHHRPVVDWGALRGSPVRFIGIKATEGPSFVDPKLKEHQAGFRRSPLSLGIYYHFARSGDPAKQARKLLTSVGKLEPRERLALDLEVAIAESTGGTIAWVNTFFHELGAAGDGRRALIYTSNRIWGELAGGRPWPVGTKDVDLWAPRYNSVGAEPRLPEPWKDVGWTIWQHSDGDIPEFSLPGVGECDGDTWRGDEADLAAYAKLEPLVT